MNYERHSNLKSFPLSHLTLETLEVQSHALKGNPLGDLTSRLNPILYPANRNEPLPVVIVLSGFTGNGTKAFNWKSFESTFPQNLNQWMSSSLAPEALFVFVDAFTFWGGSQFINSAGCGNYEDYIVNELVPALKSEYDVSEDPNRWCVMGGSSGGYGALHLTSKFPEIFKYAIAIAPDSLFQVSLLPEIYEALPFIISWGGIESVKQKLIEGDLQKRRNWHTILNVIGMAHCYAKTGELENWPVDWDTGKIKESIWTQWLEKDPVKFLPQRKSKIDELSGVFLEVGTKDQFHLQYGSRQIRDTINFLGERLHYEEFNGSHFDIGTRREFALQWLKIQWKK